MGGNAIDAVVSLMPGTDGKTAAQIDFAGGAYTMTGTATKKEKEKKNLLICLPLISPLRLRRAHPHRRRRRIPEGPRKRERR